MVTLIATLGGLVTLVCWGVSDYLTGEGGKRIDAYLLNLLIQGLAVVLWLPFALWYGLPALEYGPLFIVAMMAASFTIASIAIIKALAIGPFGITAPIANSYPLVTLFIGLGFLGLELSPYRLLALLAIVAGVIMLSVNRDTFDYRKFHRSASGISIIAAIFFGIGFALYDLVIDEYTWLQFVFILNVFMVLYAFPLFLAIHKRFPKRTEILHPDIRYAWGISLLVIVGGGILFAVSEYAGSVVIPAVVASASPLVTSFLAYAYDGERLTLYKRIGAVVIVLGLMALNLVQ